MSRIFRRLIDRITDSASVAGRRGALLTVTFRRSEAAATSYRGKSLLTNSRTERHYLLSVPLEMLQSHALAFLKNRSDVFTRRRRLPKTPSWRDPGPPGEIVENRTARNDPGIVGYVKALAASAKGNHFNMTKIPTGSSARVLPDSCVAEIDEHTPKRSPLR